MRRARGRQTLPGRITLVAGLLTIAAATGPPLAVPRAFALEHRSVRCEEVRLPSDLAVTKKARSARVVLPPGYDDPANAGRRYPVVLMLHGMGGTYRSWTRATDLVGYSSRFDAIFVTPDGDGRHGDPAGGWYSDWSDGSADWETFHTGFVTAWVDGTYRTLGARNWSVVGVSMGAFGAVRYATRHPDRFRAVAAFSGPLDTQVPDPRYGVSPFAGRAFDRVWGTDAALRSAQNPSALVSRLVDRTVIVASGTGEVDARTGHFSSKETRNSENAKSSEQYLYATERAFLSALHRAGGDANVRFDPALPHTWPAWESLLRWAMPILGRAIGAPEHAPVEGSDDCIRWDARRCTDLASPHCRRPPEV